MGFFLLAIHFISIFIYSRPFVAPKTKLEFYSQAYIYPYFQQNWNLFATVPNSNYNLYCEFENNGIQKIDVFNEVKILHQTNRLKGYGPLLISLANSIHYFEKNAGAGKVINGPINDDLNFKIIEQVTKNYLEYSRQLKIKKLKIVLVVRSQNNKPKIYFN